MIGHFEEKSGNKYLALDDVNEKKKVSKKKYEEIWEGVKKEIELIIGGENIENWKKLTFESNDDLPLNKHIKLHLIGIIIRSVFSEDVNFSLNYF